MYIYSISTSNKTLFKKKVELIIKIYFLIHFYLLKIEQVFENSRMGEIKGKKISKKVIIL